MNKFIQVSVIPFLALCSSCAVFFQEPSPVSTQQGQPGTELLFLKGDFDAALIEFARISQTAGTAEERNQALYGLACTQIMMARTDEQLTTAIGNLQKWDEEKGDMTFNENRRLLIYALKHQGDYLAEKHHEQAQQEKKKNGVIVGQQQKIAEMANKVKRLEKQLAELEAIDEKFQEKRKAL